MNEYESIPLLITSSKEFSQKEIQAQFQKAHILLADIQTAAWDKRSQSLQKLQQILMTQSAQTQFFLTGFQKLHQAISIQLKHQVNDLRSAIVNQARKTICLAAQVLGQKFQFLADKFIHSSSLFKLLQTANKVMAEHAHKCIIHILHNVVAPKIVPKICEQLRSKNQFARSKCAGYLSVIISTYPEDVLKKMQSQIEQAIIHSIGDSNPDCRASGRQCYHKYKQIFPKSSAYIQSKLDPSFQKVLQDQQKQIQSGLGLTQTIMQSSQSRKLYQPSPKPIRSVNKSVGRPSSNTSNKMNKSALQVSGLKTYGIGAADRNTSAHKLPLGASSRRVPSALSSSSQYQKSMKSNQMSSQYEQIKSKGDPSYLEYYKHQEYPAITSTPGSTFHTKRNSSSSGIANKDYYPSSYTKAKKAQNKAINQQTLYSSHKINILSDSSVPNSQTASLASTQEINRGSINNAKSSKVDKNSPSYKLSLLQSSNDKRKAATESSNKKQNNTVSKFKKNYQNTVQQSPTSSVDDDGNFSPFLIKSVDNNNKKKNYTRTSSKKNTSRNVTSPPLQSKSQAIQSVSSIIDRDSNFRDTGMTQKVLVNPQIVGSLMHVINPCLLYIYMIID